ncbi:TetR/AcrR family transcriptional regulator C-terminal domain-containing protein [Dactylosporangium sp. CA-233914]|uniref:TetR/AcrR family transcriptional regulator C-terminal domain-containing protein n=1 Tax=Dactylosporangium sp. CA-233914 TaxID=3239934 RepID=UPI003D8ED66D
MTRFATEIVADLRQRVIAGDLKPGDYYPTAHDIMRDWEATMATAYKAMLLMRQEGLAEKVHGHHGIRVTEQAPEVAAAWSPPPPPREEYRAKFRERMVRAAIKLADAGGLEGVSMRLVAEAIDARIMSLYHYVRDRAHLEVVMADTIFSKHPPPKRPTGDWRAQLERLCRLQWQMYRKHAWLAEAVTFSQPEDTPHVVAHTEWAVRALAGTGLPAPTLPDLAATAADFVRGSAMSLERAPEVRKAETEQDDALFEFGLRVLLDGFAPQPVG